jgi:hypothetical protein
LRAADVEIRSPAAETMSGSARRRRRMAGARQGPAGASSLDVMSADCSVAMRMGAEADVV